MIEGLPSYVSPLFIATTFLTVGFFFYAVRMAGITTWPTRAILFLVPFWLLFTGVLALGGFYHDPTALPPRVFLFAVLPAVILVLIIVAGAGEFLNALPLRVLTLLSLIRVPVEFTLLTLYQHGQVPRAMTFEGTNFDILSGLTAPLVAYFAFRGGRTNRPILLAWNIAALLLLANVVTTAILAFRSPMQKIAFDQPNVGVEYFPFIWLPAVVVPIVFFTHLASLRVLLTNKESDGAA
jgi:hypothetical protein